MTNIQAPEWFEELRRAGTCAAANAIETLKLRLRNEGFSNSSLTSVTSFCDPLLAYAVTVKIRCSSPPPDGPGYLERTQWWDQILSVQAPRLVVIEDVDPLPGTGALIGGVHANILKALGCAAVATNGAVRDIPQVQQLGFALFAGSRAVSHAYAHIVEMGTPVRVGGMRIEQGDLIHADCHGLLSIPTEYAPEIVRIIRRLRGREQELADICQAAEFSIDRLREAVRYFRDTPL